MTTAWLHQPPKPLPSICSPYPQKPSPDPQIPIGRASRSAEHKRPAVSSPEGCPTPADRVRASRPATADVRQPLTRGDLRAPAFLAHRDASDGSRPQHQYRKLPLPKAVLPNVVVPAYAQHGFRLEQQPNPRQCLTQAVDDLYQGAMIETHRDGFPRFSALSVRRGDAGHRKACATTSESLGKPPFRSSMRPVGGRRKALTMRRIASGFPPTRRTAWTIPMGLYHRSLVV